MSEHIYTRDEIISAILPLLKKYQAESAILFGSYARQEANAQSDIDLVVIGGPRFDPTDVFCIADDLHRLTGKQVDVYERREINAGTELYNTVFSEGVQIAWSTAMHSAPNAHMAYKRLATRGVILCRYRKKNSILWPMR